MKKLAVFLLIWFSLASARDLVANATYSGIYDEPVKLTDGVYQGERIDDSEARPKLELVDRIIRKGDLDNDGNEETVVLLSENSGGSGTFIYLAVLKEGENDATNIATTLLGDRVQVKGMVIASSQIWIDIITRGADDGACCPTEKNSLVMELDGDELKSVEADDEGVISVADLEGIDWHVVELNKGEAVLEDSEITVKFNDGMVQGTAGCNSYQAGYSGGDFPDELNVEPLLVTRKSCPPLIMAQEHEFVTKLEHVTGYSYYYGDLALQYNVDDTFGVLLLRFE